MTHDIRQEREQLECEIAERAKRIERDETLEWCRARDDERRLDAAVVTKSASPTRRDQAMTADMSGWQAYIDATAKQAETRAINLTVEVVGEAMAVLQKKLRDEFKAELDHRLLELRNVFLQAQLDEARGVRRRGSPLAVHSIEELN